MCVIIWSPSGKIPKDHVLKAMVKHPDGWGFAVPTNRGLHLYREGTDLTKFIHAWVGRPKGPVLFHARWATHGKVCGANCHPFKSRNHNLAIAHNGIIDGYGSPKKSDTRDFIERVIEPMPSWFLEEEGILAAISAAIGRSKMVFLDGEGTATIVNEHLGIWNGGLWYSNHSAF